MSCPAARTCRDISCADCHLLWLCVTEHLCDDHARAPSILGCDSRADLAALCRCTQRTFVAPAGDGLTSHVLRFDVDGCTVLMG